MGQQAPAEGVLKKGKELVEARKKAKGEPPPVPAAPKAPESQKPAAAHKPQTEKTAEEKQAGKAEQDRLANEKRILESKDEDLNTDDLAKKKELLAKKEPPKEKSNVEKRIDELVGEIKSLKNDGSVKQQKIDTLQRELEELRGTKSVLNTEAELDRLEQEREARYTEEDKKLPREKRRVLSKAEVEEWLLEDVVEANNWVVRQANRRDRERQKDADTFASNEAIDTNKKKAKDVIDAQAESQARVFTAHPELDVKKRTLELAGQGKTKQEIGRILLSENPKLRMVTKLMKENRDKYALAPNGPELIMKDALERLKEEGHDLNPKTDEEREAAIRSEAAEQERQRQEGIDTGLRSTRSSGAQTSDEETPLFKQQLALMKKLNPHTSDDELRARLKNRLDVRKGQGAS